MTYFITEQNLYLTINIMDITFSYKILRKNSILYRGTEKENKLSEFFNPYYRGLYLGKKFTASLYAMTAEERSSVEFQLDNVVLAKLYGRLRKYKIKNTLHFIIINKSNLKNIINIVKTKLKKGLTFLDGTFLCQKDVLYVIRKYSNINKDTIKINTGSKHGLYKFGKYKSPLGLWFSKIICFFGFDGYYVPAIYLRKYSKIIFHEEYFFCFPQIHLKVVK